MASFVFIQSCAGILLHSWRLQDLLHSFLCVAALRRVKVSLASFLSLRRVVLVFRFRLLPLTLICILVVRVIVTCSYFGLQLMQGTLMHTLSPSMEYYIASSKVLALRLLYS